MRTRKEYDSFTRCSLYLCCSWFAQRVYCLFISLCWSLFFFINHSRFALSCLEWKVKFISIKSKSFFFVVVSITVASFFQEHSTTVNTHSKQQIFGYSNALLLWAIDFSGECHQKIDLNWIEGFWKWINFGMNCDWVNSVTVNLNWASNHIDLNRSETTVICNVPKLIIIINYIYYE